MIRSIITNLIVLSNQSDMAHACSWIDADCIIGAGI